MARPAKPGIDYFPFDTDFFSDLRIRKLIRYQGGEAVTVYLMLLSNIYRNGYYIRWDDSLPFILSEQSGYEEDYILKVIGYCLDIGLLDQPLYESDRVLTSRAIQKRYRNIHTLSRRTCVMQDFLLITSEETDVISQKSAVSAQESPILSQKPTVNSVEIPQIKGNKNKSNKTSSDDDVESKAPDSTTPTTDFLNKGSLNGSSAAPSDTIDATLAWVAGNADKLAHECSTLPDTVLQYARQVAQSWRMTGEWDRAKPNTHMASAIKARIRKHRDNPGRVPRPLTPTEQRIATERATEQRNRASGKKIDSRAALAAYLASQGLSSDTRLAHIAPPK